MEFQVYILSFDRVGYGESDPNPKKYIRSEAFDIQELADGLQFGPKFYLLGMSMGVYPVYICLKYIPHRLSGAALVVPMVGALLSCSFIKRSLREATFLQYRWTFRIAHYAPRMFYWWMTKERFHSLSVVQGKLDVFSRLDVEIRKKLSEAPLLGQEKYGNKVYTSVHIGT